MPPAFPPSPHRDGFSAHGFGQPLSACPYELDTDDGHRWRRAWIRAERWQREYEGRMGYSRERWDEAGRMAAAEHSPDPCQEVSDNLEELEHPPTAAGGGGPAAGGRFVVSQPARVFFRRADAPDDRWQDLGPVRDAQVTIRRDDDQVASMKMAWAALAGDTRKVNQVAITMNLDTEEVAAALAALSRALTADLAALAALGRALTADLARPAPPPVPKPPPMRCPAHGVELRGGGCPKCQREQQRRESRRRR